MLGEAPLILLGVPDGLVFEAGRGGALPTPSNGCGYSLNVYC